MEQKILQLAVIERYGNDSAWKAYFAADPENCGVGRSKGGAVASLYLNSIGALILKNPEDFGLRIEEK